MSFSSSSGGALSLVLVVSACGGSGAVPPPVTTDGGVATTCTAGGRCLEGKLDARALGARWVDAKVELFGVYPYGKVTPIGTATVRGDAFAFADLPEGKYWLQAVAKLDDGSGPASISTIAGPFGANGSASLTVRPVFLEVLQTRAAGAQLEASWASARVYDPKSGKPLTDATVKLTAGGSSFAMPYGDNLAGQKSYFVQLPKGTPGATTFTIETSHPSLGAAPLSWNLVAEVPTFDVALQSPSDGSIIGLALPLEVTWTAQPTASYGVVELFSRGTSGDFTRLFTSEAALPPDTSRQVIPADKLIAGNLLLNVREAIASCPPSADGCVYSASTAAASLKAQ
jgi:hypothetical protein